MKFSLTDLLDVVLMTIIDCDIARCFALGVTRCNGMRIVVQQLGEIRI